MLTKPLYQILYRAATYCLRALGVFLLFYTVLDGPAPDESAMAPVRPARTTVSLPATAAQSEFLRLLAIYRPSSGDRAQLEIHTQLIAPYDALLEHDLEQVNWPDGLTQRREDDIDRYPLAELRHLMNLLTRRIADAREKGEAQRATLEALNLCRLGHSLQTAPSSCGIPGFGILLQDTGLGELKQTLTSPAAAASKGCLKTSLQTLSQLQGPSRETLLFTSLDHYQFIKQVCCNPNERIDYIRSCRSLPPGYRKFKVNKTLQLAITQLAPLHEALAHDWATAYDMTIIRHSPVPVIASRWHIFHGRLRNKLGGESLAAHCSNWTRSEIHDAVETISKNRITCAMIALRLHQLEHLSLPEKPSRMSPELRELLPKDILTDTRYLWDRTTGTVTSADGVSFKETYWWNVVP